LLRSYQRSQPGHGGWVGGFGDGQVHRSLFMATNSSTARGEIVVSAGRWIGVRFVVTLGVSNRGHSQGGRAT
jgi:hypothetical protein